MDRRNLWGAWAVAVGAAFGIVAVTHAGGIFYVVVAIIAGAGYSAIRLLTRKPPAEPGRPAPPGPGA
jgi:hypothetical protein